jgi:hypothetical protein
MCGAHFLAVTREAYTPLAFYEAKPVDCYHLFLPMKLAKTPYMLLLALSAVALSSCAIMEQSSGPRDSFTFDPPVTQPSNPANVEMKVSTGAGRLYIVEGNEVLLATPATVGRSASPTPHGNFTVRDKTRHRRRFSQPGAGYPMTYWIEFYNPAYGMHWGFMRPYPNTAGCVRLPLKAARKAFDLVRVGTPINVATSQPWDQTIGKTLPDLSDEALANPPLAYMKSPQVFADAEQGRLWKY